MTEEEKQQPIQISVDKAPPLPLKIANSYVELLKTRPVVAIGGGLVVAALAGVGVFYKVNNVEPESAQVVINSGGPLDPLDDPSNNLGLEGLEAVISGHNRAAAWQMEGSDIYPMASSFEVKKGYYPTALSAPFSKFRASAIGDNSCTELDLGTVINQPPDKTAVCPILSERTGLAGFVSAPTVAEAEAVRKQTQRIMEQLLGS